MRRTTSWLTAGLLGVGGLFLLADTAQAQFSIGRGGYGRGGGLSINLGGGGFNRGGFGYGGNGYGRPGLGYGGYGYGRPGLGYGNYGYGGSGLGYGGFNNRPYYNYGSLYGRSGYGYGNYGYGRGNNTALWTAFGLNALGSALSGGNAYGGYYAAPAVVNVTPNYYSGGSYLNQAPAYDYGEAAPAYGENYAAPAPQAEPQPVAENRARLHVIVPDQDAQVWFDGRKTTTTGTTREFMTPDLAPGQDYHYTITAAFNHGGRVVTQERQVNVRAGAETVVDFTRPQADGGPGAGAGAGASLDFGIRGEVGGPAGGTNPR